MPEIAGLAEDRPAWRQHLATVDEVGGPRPILRLARLLAPVAEDGDARAEIADRLLERLRFSNAERRRVSRLARAFLPFVGPMDSAASIRAWLSDVGDAWRDLVRLHIAGSRAARETRQRDYMVAAWRRIHGVVLDGPPLALADLRIDGADVLRLGVAPGPIVGLLLEELLEQVLEDPDRNDRETLLSEAKRLVEIGALAGQTGPPGGPGRVDPGEVG